MAQASYIPTQDAALNNWAQNFSALINANPALYGVTISDAQTVSTYVGNWNSAYLVVTNPATKTKPSVAQKDAARAAMLGIVRPIAQNIKNNPGVTNESKLALGLNVDSTSRTPILVPQTQPLITVIGATPLTHTIRYADSNTPDKRSKPFGAVQLGLWAVVGTAIGTDPKLATYIGGYTVQPLAVTWTPSDQGKVATYWARYVGRRGDLGPWSAPAAFIIA